jgi:hypothetical protein
MPINFPDNPTDNQEFNGYIYDATRGVWDVKLASDPLGAINLTSPAAGEALVFNGTNWVNQEVATPASVKTIDSDTIAIDFSDGIPLEKRTVAGDITITASNYTAGITKQILLQGDTVARTITFPAQWNFLDDPVTKIGANKTNILTINCFGTTEDSVFVGKAGPSAWEPIVASGGVENIVGNYKIHQFNTSDNFTISSVPENTEIEILMVAGGGAGGGRHGGGGGGGGLLAGTISSDTLSEGVFPVFVGAGAPATVGQTQGANGSDSTFSSYVADGGGGAGAYNNSTSLPGLSGGSGGGGGDGHPGGTSTQTSYAGVTGFGHSGGAGKSSQDLGGGGGAGTAGQDASGEVKGGDGGDGFLSNILGTSYYFAGGGGGATWNNAGGNGGLGGGGGGGAAYGTGPAGNGGGSALNSGQNGFYNGTGTSGNAGGGAGGQNTGGGGGGVGQDNWNSVTGDGGPGGSGVVVIRYRLTDPN